MPSFHKFKGNVRAKGEDVLVTNMYFGEEKSKGGIILRNDNGRVEGIRARWCQVYSIGPMSKLKNDIKVGDWIMLEHGRWSRSINIVDNDGVEWLLQKADIDSILLSTQEEPEDVKGWLEHNKEKREYVEDILVNKEKRVEV